jgi:hypothetical protein
MNLILWQFDRPIFPKGTTFETGANLVLCLAKISSALKIARLALCLGLKREAGFGQELL